MRGGARNCERGDRHAMKHVVPVSRDIPNKAFYVTQGLYLTIKQVNLERLGLLLRLVMPDKVPDWRTWPAP